MPDGNQRPIIGHSDRPKTPRPREQRMIADLVSGEPRSVSNVLVRAGFNPGSKSIRNRLIDGDLREELDRQLEEAGLTLPLAIKRLSTKLDATKRLTIAGEAETVDDNDAQLRAIDMTLKLHERTGRIPSAQESAASGAQITVNILVMKDED